LLPLKTASDFVTGPDFIQHIPPSYGFHAKWVHPGVFTHVCAQREESTCWLPISLFGKSHPLAHTVPSGWPDCQLICGLLEPDFIEKFIMNI